MLALMEDLLVLAKVGHVQRPAEPVDLNTVLEEVPVGNAIRPARHHFQNIQRRNP